MPTLTHSAETLHCRKCGHDKPASAFYAGRPTRCRACYVVKAREWVLKNRERERANARRYRTSAKGRQTCSARKQRWRARNTSSEIQHNKRYLERLPDAYVRKLLRYQHGIPVPTAEQIEAHRNRIKILRAHRAFNLLAYGAKLTN
jgi:hypothetical protein